MQTITKTATLVWQNPYVTDSLVAYWDGYWNAGDGIHDPNATSWKDLAGSHDLALSHIPEANRSWTGKSFRLVGDNLDVNKQLTMSSLISSKRTFTISYLVNFESVNPSAKRYAPFAFQGYGIGFNWYGNDFFATLPWPDAFMGKKFDTLVGRDFMCTMAADGTRLRTWLDGESLGNQPCGDYASLLNGKLRMMCVGNPIAGETPWICNTRRTLIYDRAITASENAFNREIDMARFKV